MIRASLYAVAVIALGTPRRAAIRRKNAPKALLLRCSDCAATRSACAARLTPGRVLALLSLPPLFLGLGARPSQAPNARSLCQGLQLRLDLAVTGDHLLLVVFVELQRLLQGEQMFGLPGPFQGPGELGLGVLAAGLTQLRQLLRVAFARQDGLDDGQPGHSR